MSAFGLIGAVVSWPLKIVRGAAVLSGQTFALAGATLSIAFNPKVWTIIISLFVLWFAAAIIADHSDTFLSGAESAYRCRVQPTVDVALMIVKNLAIIYDRLVCFWNLYVGFWFNFIREAILISLDCILFNTKSSFENILTSIGKVFVFLLQDIVTFLAVDPFHNPLDIYDAVAEYMLIPQYLINTTTCLCADIAPGFTWLNALYTSPHIPCAINATINFPVKMWQQIFGIILNFPTITRPNFNAAFDQACFAVTCISNIINDFLHGILVLIFPDSTPTLEQTNIFCILDRALCIGIKILSMGISIIVNIDIIVVEIFGNGPFDPSNFFFRGASQGGLDILGLFTLIDGHTAQSLAGCIEGYFSQIDACFGAVFRLIIELFMTIPRGLYATLTDFRFLFNNFFSAPIMKIDQLSDKIGCLFEKIFRPITGSRSPCGGVTPSSCAASIGLFVNQVIDLLLIPFRIFDRIFLLIGDFLGLGSPTYSFVDTSLHPEKCHPNLGPCTFVPLLGRAINSFGDDVVGIVLDFINVVVIGILNVLGAISNILFNCVPCFGFHVIFAGLQNILTFLLSPLGSGGRLIARTFRVVFDIIYLFYLAITGQDTSAAGAAFGDLILNWLYEILNFILALLFLIADYTIFYAFTTFTGVRFTSCMCDFGQCVCYFTDLCTTKPAPCFTFRKRSATDGDGGDLSKRAVEYAAFNFTETNMMLMRITPNNTVCSDIFRAFHERAEASLPELDHLQYIDCVQKYKVGLDMHAKYPSVSTNAYLAMDAPQVKQEVTTQGAKAFGVTMAWMAQRAFFDMFVPSNVDSFIVARPNTLNDTLSDWNVTHPYVLSFADAMVGEEEKFKTVTWDMMRNFTVGALDSAANTTASNNLTLEDYALYGMKTVQLGVTAATELGTAFSLGNVTTQLFASYTMLRDYFSANGTMENTTNTLTGERISVTLQRDFMHNNPFNPFTWDSWRADPLAGLSEATWWGYTPQRWASASALLDSANSTTSRLSARIKYISNLIFYPDSYQTDSFIPGFDCLFLDRVVETIVAQTTRCFGLLNSTALTTAQLSEILPQSRLAAQYNEELRLRREPLQLQPRSYFTKQYRTRAVIVSNYTKTFDLTHFVYDVWDFLVDQLDTPIENLFNISITNSSSLSDRLLNFFTSTDLGVDDPNRGLLFYITWPFICRIPENVDCTRGLGILKGYGFTLVLFVFIIPIASALIPLIGPIWKLIFGVLGVTLFFSIANAIAFYYSPFCMLGPKLPECVGREVVKFIEPLNTTCFKIPQHLVIFPADGSCVPCGERREFIKCSRDRGFFDGLDNLAFLIEWTAPGVNDFVRTNLGVIPWLETPIIRGPLDHFNYDNISSIPQVDKDCFYWTIGNLAPVLGVLLFAIPIVFGTLTLLIYALIFAFEVIFYSIGVLISVIAFLHVLRIGRSVSDQTEMLMALSYMIARAEEEPITEEEAEGVEAVGRPVFVQSPPPPPPAYSEHVMETGMAPQYVMPVDVAELAAYAGAAVVATAPPMDIPHVGSTTTLRRREPNINDDTRIDI